MHGEKEKVLTKTTSGATVISEKKGEISCLKKKLTLNCWEIMAVSKAKSFESTQ